MTPLQLAFSKTIHNCGRKTILSSKNRVCHEKMTCDLQSAATGFNFGILSKSLASDNHQHVSECETGPTGTHKLGRSVHRLLLQKEISQTVMSRHGTSAGPSKGCSFHPHSELALLKKIKNKKKERVNQVCSTPNFLLHQPTETRGTGEKEKGNHPVFGGG